MGVVPSRSRSLRARQTAPEGEVRGPGDPVDDETFEVEEPLLELGLAQLYEVPRLYGDLQPVPASTSGAASQSAVGQLALYRQRSTAAG